MELKRVTADEAQKLTEQGYVLLDVRSIPEYAQGHVPGAYNIPYLHKTAQGMLPNESFAQVVRAAFPDPNAKIVTHCQMGGRSVRAAQELLQLGYAQVVDLRGGFGGEKDDTGNVVVPGWKDRGLPVEIGDGGETNYQALSSRAGVESKERPKAAAPPADTHGHDHGAAGHSHGPAAPTGGARFAHPSAKVHCAKLGSERPALKRQPLVGPLGERVKAQISAEAWEQWVEHSKLFINEYRLNPSDAKAQQLLLAECEKYLFGEGSSAPDEFKPS